MSIKLFVWVMLRLDKEINKIIWFFNYKTPIMMNCIHLFFRNFHQLVELPSLFNINAVCHYWCLYHFISLHWGRLIKFNLIFSYFFTIRSILRRLFNLILMVNDFTIQYKLFLGTTILFLNSFFAKGSKLLRDF